MSTYRLETVEIRVFCAWLYSNTGTYVRELCTYKNMSYYWKGSKLASSTYILIKFEDTKSITKIIRIANDTVAVNSDDNVT